ncbi:cytochrome c3 family protein [Desulfococcaceae bacterium HSG8]|nr:cytochrome c3 family protein [Desulfococcaceae bacterium HSG8]
MGSNKELQLAYGLAVILLIVGIVSYAASSTEVPDEPVRLMFECATGKVLFDHKIHASEYDLSCGSCHHHPEDAEESLACRECHVLPADGSAPESCADCHEPDDFEIEAIVKKSDVLHSQCIGCHEENDAEVNGRGAEECSSCHVSYSF